MTKPEGPPPKPSRTLVGQPIGGQKPEEEPAAPSAANPVSPAELAAKPGVVATGWSEEQKRAYAIADNKLALNADWDDDLLRIELGELKGLGVDLGLVGFGQIELDALFARGTQAIRTRMRFPIPRPTRRPWPATYGCLAATALLAATARRRTMWAGR